MIEYLLKNYSKAFVEALLEKAKEENANIKEKDFVFEDEVWIFNDCKKENK